MYTFSQMDWICLRVWMHFTSLSGFILMYYLGTVGGIIMDLSFSILYILMFVYPLGTVLYTVYKDIYHHKRWALRTFAIVSSPIVYHGIYMLIDTGNYRRVIDYTIDSLFFIIPLMIVEIYMLICGCLSEVSKLDGKP